MNGQLKPENNVLPFNRPGTGDDVTGNNWLRNMTHGTRFLATDRRVGGSKLCDFVVASDPKSMPAVFIGEDINSPHGGFRFVDPEKFVKDYGFYMTLEVLEPPDGNDNKIPAGRVDGNAKSKKRVKVHEGEQRVPPGSEPGPVRPSFED